MGHQSVVAQHHETATALPVAIALLCPRHHLIASLATCLIFSASRRQIYLIRSSCDGRPSEAPAPPQSLVPGAVPTSFLPSLASLQPDRALRATQALGGQTSIVSKSPYPYDCYLHLPTYANPFTSHSPQIWQPAQSSPPPTY